MIVLLTDFGESEYVGIMKGVLLGYDSDIKIVDLTHSVTPQSVREGAWILINSYRYFPEQSIFVCVVDPGVGTSRDAVLVKTPEHVFIGPDNGLLYPATRDAAERQVYSIHPDSIISHTFHGRDVFAVAAGKYHSGVDLEEIGTPKTDLEVPLSFYLKGRTGEVVRIDRFGNIITNIPPTDSETLEVSYGSRKFTLPLCETYAHGPSLGPFLLVGSYGTLEIAIQNKRAIDYLSVDIGEKISIE
ncbi:MAG: S-adenosyl-l-methionine hydroxide adenosyltransferase family protein [Candidatus Thorarchaeota archaeon]